MRRRAIPLVVMCGAWAGDVDQLGVFVAVVVPTVRVGAVLAAAAVTGATMSLIVAGCRRCRT